MKIEIHQNTLHKPLKHCRSILETKGHHIKHIEALVGDAYECRFCVALRVNLHPPGCCTTHLALHGASAGQPPVFVTQWLITSIVSLLDLAFSTSVRGLQTSHCPLHMGSSFAAGISGSSSSILSLSCWRLHSSVSVSAGVITTCTSRDSLPCLSSLLSIICLNSSTDAVVGSPWPATTH